MESIKNYFINTIDNLKKGINETYKFVKTHKYVSLSSLFLLIYIILFYIITFRYSFKVFEEYNLITNIIFLTIGLIWGFSILFKYNNINKEIKSAFFINIKNVFLITLGLVLFFSIIYILSSSYTVNNFISIIINVLLVVGGLYLLYRLLKNSRIIKKLRENYFFNILYQSIFLIPSYLVKSFTNISQDIKTTPKFIFTMLFFEALLIFLYFMYPKIVHSVYTYNSKMLLNKPIYTDYKNTIGNYEKLYKDNNKLKIIGKEELNYNFGLSCWVFIDNIGENYNEKSNKFTSLINYGNKPNIQYNPSIHTLIVKMKTGIDNEKIIYENKNIRLQKWNNIVVNNNGGTTDIFLNGELVATQGDIIPFMKLDNIETGEDEGIPGSICNVLYYSEPISKVRIDWLYNYFKNKTPPVI
jgi:hypothetical protein